MGSEEKLLKGPLRKIGVFILLLALGLLYWVLAPMSPLSLWDHRELKGLSFEGGLSAWRRLCLAELAKIKPCNGVLPCEFGLKDTCDSLAAALGVPTTEESADRVTSSPSCPPPCLCNASTAPPFACPPCSSQLTPPSPAVACPPCPTASCPACPTVTCPACPKVSCFACPKVICPACQKVSCPACPSATAPGSEARSMQQTVDGLQVADVESMSVEKLKSEVKELRTMGSWLKQSKEDLRRELNSCTKPDVKNISAEAMESAKKLLGDCNQQVAPATVGGSAGGGEITSWKGYQCKAKDSELARYLNYTPRGLCPQDWFFVQRLIFAKDCFALPRRRCLTVTPPNPQEPMPFPASLFDQEALMSSNVRWDLHQCKSFECINNRQLGDCIRCFNISHEERRWTSHFAGEVAKIINLKEKHLRIGLDIGAGTGSFAALMARYNVTVLSTAYNVETVPGRRRGLPYMEAIALRGLIPLHVPHKSRFPLYDGTLDVIHTSTSIKYLPLLQFEELLFECDRMLRAGGILWFDNFYNLVTEMPVYVQLVEMLGYKKLYWQYTPKTDGGEKKGQTVFLHFILEKPVRPGTEVLDGPPPEDIDP